ncbi:hypothetical protein [Thermogutta sp.]|uniref:hypothetical protein n=1 Tax=Thermogutta sp. TaxID=1962930 RepID=UPI003220332A
MKAQHVQNGIACLLIGIALAILGGCGKSGVPTPKTYQIPMKGPLEEAKALLENYASGAPMGSEASRFKDLVDAVRKTDPAKADVLEKGFAELQKTSPQGLAPKAREILNALNK